MLPPIPCCPCLSCHQTFSLPLASSMCPGKADHSPLAFHTGSSGGGCTLAGKCAGGRMEEITSATEMYLPQQIYPFTLQSLGQYMAQRFSSTCRWWLYRRVKPPRRALGSLQKCLAELCSALCEGSGWPPSANAESPQQWSCCLCLSTAYGITDYRGLLTPTHDLPGTESVNESWSSLSGRSLNVSGCSLSTKIHMCREQLKLPSLFKQIRKQGCREPQSPMLTVCLEALILCDFSAVVNKAFQHIHGACNKQKKAHPNWEWSGSTKQKKTFWGFN